MTTDEVRKKYLSFFKASPRNHREISPAPLIPSDDPTTLFTSSGMQQLVPYLMGKSHSEGKRLVNSQPSLRTVDIDEVGNTRHLTYFEMLGNWSLGDYFKKEQLTWFWEFLTQELKLPREKLWVSVFKGTKGVDKDSESFEIWKKIGVPEERIHFYGVDKNWWSRSGTPARMPEGEIGGPDSEVFFEFTQVKHDPKFGKKCHPNCDCRRFLEIGNNVFIQYKKLKNGDFEELPQKNIDFGGGLERLTAAVNDDPDVFKIDIYEELIKKIEEKSGKGYEGNKRDMRIIADHMRASEALIKEGVEPSNKRQGYVLRRLIRRSAVKMRGLRGGNLGGLDLIFGFDQKVKQIVGEEVEKYIEIRERGRKEIIKIASAQRLGDAGDLEEKKYFLVPEDASKLHQSFGTSLPTIMEIAKEEGIELVSPPEGFKERYIALEKEHAEKSRNLSSGVFKSGLADKSQETKKLHTVTHLLHAALRKVLGKHVQQKGSNITAERLRFDFSHPQKLTAKEIAKVEAMINKQIGKNLKVISKTMSYEAAIKKGALAFFSGKYGEKVKVYSIGDFSQEVCAGPHVASTGEIGRVRIIKQESAGAGVRRIYAAITAQK